MLVTDKGGSPLPATLLVPLWTKLHRVKFYLQGYQLVAQSIPFVLPYWECQGESNSSRVNGHFPWRWQVLTIEEVRQPIRFWQMPRNPKSDIYYPVNTPSSHPSMALNEHRLNGPKSQMEIKPHIAVKSYTHQNWFCLHENKWNCSTFIHIEMPF